MTMTDMPLEQVRDVLDNRAAHFAKIGEGQAALELRDVMDAIDSALKARGEPVA
jgi:predicted transcriptional regulator